MIRKSVMIILAFVFIFPFLVTAQQKGTPLSDLKIQDIKADLLKYKDEYVKITGFVTQFVEATAKTTSFYFLKDDWGGIIKVRTSKEPPEVGKKYVVRGTIGIDTTFGPDGEPYISEESKQQKGIPLSDLKIQDIKADLLKYNDEYVEITGFVTQFVEATEKTTSFYFLKDDWDGIIKVRKSKEPPEVDKRYVVRGTIGIDTTFGPDGEPYISEESKQPAELVSVVAREEAKEGLSTEMIIIIAAICVVFLILLVLMIKLLKGGARAKQPTGSYDSEISKDFRLPEPQDVIEGTTIKMSVPPPGTLKLLPGKLKIVSGEESIQEIKFYRIPNQEMSEMTFGRAQGPEYSHIQLKARTVSSRQAKITYLDKEKAYQLTNFAKESSNPTIVNGRSMGVEESVVLKDKDKIQMGEVIFEFHSK